MKIIKYTLSILIILLLFVFLIVPMGIGFWVQHSYQRVIDHIPTTPGFSAEITQFDRGWFDSKATILLTSRGKIKDTRYTMNMEIEQGPLIVTKAIGGSTHYLFALAKTVTTSKGINIKSIAIWHFNNVIDAKLFSKLAAIKLSGTSLSVKNLRGSTSFNRNKNTLKARIKADSAQLAMQTSISATPTSLVNATGINYAGNIHRIGLINYGKQFLQLDTLSIPADNKKTRVLNKVSVISNISKKNEETNIQMTLIAQKIENSPFGAKMLKVNFSFNDLNTKALSEFLKTMRQQKQSINNRLRITELTKPTFSLLRNGLSIKLNQLYIGTAQGPVEAIGTFNIPKSKDNVGILQTIAQISAGFHFQAPKQWLLEQVTNLYATQKSKEGIDALPQNKAIATIRNWQAKNYLKSSGNYYVSTISFKNGKLNINGTIPNFHKPPKAQGSSTQFNKLQS